MSQKAIWFALSITILFYCYEFFLRISPSALIGPIMLSYHVDAEKISEILAIYYLAYSLNQLPAGLIIDRFPLYKVLPMAALICAVGVYVFTITSNLWMPLIGRFLLGVGSSFAFIAVLKLAREKLPNKYFGIIVGFAIAFGTLTASYAEVLILSLHHHMPWQKLFYIAIALGLIIALMLFYGIRNLAAQSKTISWQENYRQVKFLLRKAAFWQNAVLGGLFYAPTSILAALWGTYFLAYHCAISYADASFCLSLLFLGWAVGSPIMGWLSQYFDCIKLMQVFAFSVLLISLGVIYFPCPHYLFLLLFLFGLFSSAQILVWQIFNNIVPSQIEGVGAALNNTIIMLITGLMQWLIGCLLGSHDKIDDPNFYLQHNGKIAFLILPISLLLSLILSVFLKGNLTTRK